MELRRERTRVALTATLPLLLWALTVVARVWAPDLAPFGERQAAALAEARHVTEQAGLWTLLAGPGPWSPLSIAFPLLTALPSPVEAWVHIKALVDGVAAVLVFLVARSLVGTGAGIVAALVYGLSPWAWVLTRDPAAASLPLISAAALLAATRLIRSPGPVWGLVAGLLVGLLVGVDPAGWSMVAGLAVSLILARGTWAALTGTLAGLMFAAGPLLWAGATPSAMLTWWNAVEAAGTRDALSSMRLVGEVAAGSGVERRLVGIAELPAPPAILVSLAFGGVAGLLVLGAWRSVELARGGRRELAAPLVWTVVPAVMLIVGGGPLRPDLLQSLLPGFAVVVALATAPIGRWSARLRPVALIVAGTFAGFGGATIAVLLWSAMGHSQTHAAVPYAAWASAGTSRDEAVREWRDSPAASLRFWQSVASEARDAASRTGRPEIAVVGGGASDAGASILSSLLGDEIAVRPLPPETVVLPLEREAIYLLMPGQQAPPELAWPSARLGSVPLTPTDAAARVVALRPRPVAHWLALHPGGTEVRFADGTVLLAARSRTVPGGQHEVELVWLTGSPASDQPEPRATEVSVTERVTGDDSRVARVPLPEPLASGGTELVVQRITLGASPPAGPASVSVRPTSESGRTVQPIDRASGTDGGVDIMRSR